MAVQRENPVQMGVSLDCESLLLFWVVLVSTVKELKLSYYSGETILITVYPLW